MDILIAVYVFGVAACVGSFLNVIIYRVPLGRSFTRPASACGSCGEPLRWWMNTPIAGYLYNHGRCGFCGAPYSIRYALIELFCAGMATWVWWIFGSDVFFCVTAWCFLGIGICVFWIDVDHWIIPDGLNLFGVLAGLGLAMVRKDLMPLVRWGGTPVGDRLLDVMLAGVLAFAGFWLLSMVGKVLVRQEALGFGDVKYAPVLGVFLGLKLVVVGCVVSFLIGGLYAIPVLLFRLRGAKQAVPFGTFMSVGGFVVLLYGEAILHWYRYSLFGGL